MTRSKIVIQQAIFLRREEHLYRKASINISDLSDCTCDIYTQVLKNINSSKVTFVGADELRKPCFVSNVCSRPAF